MSIKPAGLHQGDLIGVLSVAGPVTQEDLEPGLSLLEAKGYRIKTSPYLYEKQGYLAGADDLRLGELQTMFGDREVKAVFCSRGGYGSLRLLEKIDFELIRSHPKIFMGFSDVTALLWAFYHKAGLVAFHGPVVKSLGSHQAQNLDFLERLLQSPNPLQLNLSNGKIIQAGRATGTLLGGNLSLISRLIGTPFMPSLKGSILFLEDIGEPLYRLDRKLTHLRLSGLLESLAGIVLGRFKDCKDQERVYALFEERLSGLPIPVCSGLAVGHGTENLALPIGIQATLDTDQMTLTLDEAWLADG